MRNREIEEILSRNPRKIMSKQESYLLYERGFFGNKPLTWKSYDEVIRSGWKGSVSIRQKIPSDANFTRYNIPLEKIREAMRELEDLGFYEDDLSFNQSMPDYSILIQGDLKRDCGGIYLMYSTLPKPMNTALEEGPRHSHGLHALNLIRSKMTPSSFYDVETLMDMFPDSTIEFSTFGMNLGSIPGRNTVIWEVRNY